MNWQADRRRERYICTLFVSAVAGLTTAYADETPLPTTALDRITAGATFSGADGAAAAAGRFTNTEVSTRTLASTGQRSFSSGSSKAGATGDAGSATLSATAGCAGGNCSAAVAEASTDAGFSGTFTMFRESDGGAVTRTIGVAAGDAPTVRLGAGGSSGPAQHRSVTTTFRRSSGFTAQSRTTSRIG